MGRTRSKGHCKERDCLSSKARHKGMEFHDTQIFLLKFYLDGQTVPCEMFTKQTEGDARGLRGPQVPACPLCPSPPHNTTPRTTQQHTAITTPPDNHNDEYTTPHHTTQRHTTTHNHAQQHTTTHNNTPPHHSTTCRNT